jgi:NAD(P)-dependent dehydrogenase (short-subunit alcohol dehydrogenase family)
MRVLLTGAASGIGRATCLRLARDAKACPSPTRIAAVDLAPSADLEGVVDELRGLGAEAIPLPGDMGTADAPARVVGDAIMRFGGLDALVSNAGINRPGALVDYAVEDWDRVFAVNTRATWLLGQAAHGALTAAGARSWPSRRCRGRTPTRTSAPTDRARRPSSCSYR